MTTGEKVRQHRKAKGLSQRELASKIGVGLSTVSFIENDKVTFNTATLAEMCKVLECTPNDLVCF